MKVAYDTDSEYSFGLSDDHGLWEKGASSSRVKRKASKGGKSAQATLNKKKKVKEIYYDD